MKMNPASREAVVRLSDGARTSIEIAALTGLRPRNIRKIAQKLDLPRLSVGSRRGQYNHQFETGRRIGTDGYAYITAPSDHPYARVRSGRQNVKIMPEHRLVLEKKLGRYLLPTEIADHIDGLTLHNNSENLRLFASNAEHLHETLAGRSPKISPAGKLNTGLRTDQGKAIQRVDMYRQRKASGDIRLRQILLLALSLGADSPYLLGTHHHTRKAGIDMSDHSTIERALADLYRRWE